VFVVRIVAVLVAIALGACVVLWLFTGNRKWLRYAWGLFRVALALLVGFAVLLFAERLLVAQAVVGNQFAQGASGRRVAHPGVQSTQRIDARCGQLHSLFSFSVRHLGPNGPWLHPYGN
jgi:hypothetical protein